MSKLHWCILPTENTPIFEILSLHTNSQDLPGPDGSVFVYVQVTDEKEYRRET